ncbi:MAG: recombination protein RecT [Chromatiales bacterium]|nr:recombination protein RecT [Chromatiales bacterium]
MLPVQKQNYTTVAQMMEKNRDSIAAALPKHLTVERLSRVALGELRTNPKLLECAPASLMNAIVKASQLGLEVGSAMGHAYLVPYKTECTLIIGYRGMIALARRSGEIQSITARVVYARDTFELEYGLEEKLRHVPSTDEDPGPVTHVYAVAKLKDGGIQYEVMTRAEVEAIRKRSRAGGSGPWVTDWNEMARKTVMRRLFKYLPMSIEMADAMSAEADDDRPSERNVTGTATVTDLNARLAASAEILPQARATEQQDQTDPEPVEHHPNTSNGAASEQHEANSGNATDWPQANPETGELIDSRGIAWDKRIHSTTKKCNDDGTWCPRRGVDPRLVEKLEHEAMEATVKAQNAELPLGDESATTDPHPTEDWSANDAPTDAPITLTFEQIREGMATAADMQTLDDWAEESRHVVITQSQRATLDLVYDQRMRQLNAGQAA